MKRILLLNAVFFAGIGFGDTSLPRASSASSPSNFTLLDKVCVVVEGEEPILLSEIKKRAEQRGESFLVAERELIRDRMWWVYAKKQLKYDIASFYKTADEHIANVMKVNDLTKSQLEELLLGAPYFSTFRQFRFETATEYLKNSVRQTIMSQTTVTDDQLRSEAAQKFDVVFITVQPKQSPKSRATTTSARSPLTREIEKANAIRRRIEAESNVNDIKKLYKGDEDVSIIGPLAYEKNVLKKAYDERLKSATTDHVIGPFEDDGSITMIWKVKKNTKNLDTTALEKLRKESYHNAVQEKFNSLTDALINSSTVIEKGCVRP